jgi:hypothetical protein
MNFVPFTYQHNSRYAWFCVSNSIPQTMHWWCIYFIFWALAMLYVEVPYIWVIGWHLQCTPECWNTFNTHHGETPKAEITCQVPRCLETTAKHHQSRSWRTELPEEALLRSSRSECWEGYGGDNKMDHQWFWGWYYLSVVLGWLVSCVIPAAQLHSRAFWALHFTNIDSVSEIWQPAL